MKTMTEAMKKAFLILIITAFASTTWSQSLSTVRGKTKEGKTLQVTYYHGASEDYIETVKYQVVDDLQARITKLQNENKDLQNKLDATNKRLKETQDNANSASNSTNEQIAQLQNQIAENEGQIELLNNEINQLRSQADSLSDKATIDQLKTQQLLKEKDQRIAELSKQKSQPQKPVTSPVLGIEANFGLVLPSNCINAGWNNNNKTSTQIDIYYGTQQLTKSFPLSIEAGIGIQMFSLSANKSAHSLNISTNDYDGIAYNALYYYSALEEDLKLTYFNIPIRICIGQPIKNQVTVYAKLGITPSIILSSNYTASGTYSIKGYYPEWGVLLENIEELGFANNQDYNSEGEQPEINKFVIWGNLALGAHIPVGHLPLQVNAGIKFDYSLMSIGAAKASASMPEGKGLLPNGGNMLATGFNIGLIYTLK